MGAPEGSRWTCLAPEGEKRCSISFPGADPRHRIAYGCGYRTPPAPSTPGEGDGRPLPEFQMVACADHMLTGHRWRCRACRREVERQFQECCEEMWRLQRTTPAPPASPVPPTRPDTDELRATAHFVCGDIDNGRGDDASDLILAAADWIDAQPAPLTPTPQPSEEATDA